MGEKQGRRHSSTVTVVVVGDSRPDEGTGVVDRCDVRVDTYRDSGAGGQGDAGRDNGAEARGHRDGDIAGESEGHQHRLEQCAPGAAVAVGERVNRLELRVG